MKHQKSAAKSAFILFLSLLLLLLPSCGAKSGRVYDALYSDCFDTVCSLYATCDSDARFAEVQKGFYALLKELNGLFDVYNDYDAPNLKTVNDNAGSAVKVDGRILKLLRFSLDFAELSGGAVTPTAGALTSLWKDAAKEGVPPTDEEINAALAHVGTEALILDEENSTVTLTDPDARIDVGATAKGFAARLLAGYLDEAGVSDYCLSLGGNVSAKGVDPRSESLWLAGVRNPDLESENYSVRSFLLSYESVATSGGYQRYFDYKGVRYHHVIDLETGYPSARSDTASVSVVHNDPALADALSTALYILTPEDGAALLRKTGGSALYVNASGELTETDGFPETPKDQTRRRDIITIVVVALALVAVIFWWVLDKKRVKDLQKHPEKAQKKTPRSLGRFKKRDMILLGALALCALLLPLTLIHGSANTESYRVVVLQDGKEVYSCPLDEDGVYKVVCGEGFNTVVVHDGAVSVRDADCEGKDCVGAGSIDASSGIRVICCLPHKLIVRIDKVEN